MILIFYLRATLFLIDETSNQLWAKQKDVGEIRVPIGKGIASHVAISGETVNVVNAYANPAFYPEIDRVTGYKTHSVLCMPVRDVVTGKPVAVLQALNKKGW
jgi:putative methionine-R-sulfoxide reductase with GAF domain